MIIPSMARTRRYMHGQRRRQCPTSPMKSHHFDTPHVMDKEGNIIGVASRHGLRIEGRNAMFDRSSQEQADIEFSELNPRQQRRIIRQQNRNRRRQNRFSRRMQRRANRHG